MLWGILGLLLVLPVAAVAQEPPALPAAWFDVGENESAIVVNFYQDISPQLLEIMGDEYKTTTYTWDPGTPIVAQFRVPPGEYKVYLPFEGGSVLLEAKAGQISILDFAALDPKDTKTLFEQGVTADILKGVVAAAESKGFAIDPSISYIYPTASVIDIRARMPPGVKPPAKPEPEPPPHQ